MTADQPDYMAMLTSGQASRILGISTERLRQLAVAGRIPSTNTPYGRLYDPVDVQRLKAKRERPQVRAQEDDRRWERDWLDGVSVFEDGLG